MKKTIFLTLLQALITLSVNAQADTWDPVVANGFGSPQNYAVITFAEYNDTLYAGCSRTGAGTALIMKSGDGTTWSPVTYDASNTNIKGIPSMSTAKYDGTEYMWIGTGNPAQGTQVYRSTDGRSFTPISRMGFGNPDAIVPTPNMLLFQGIGDTIPYLYAAANSHGGSANSTVWRAPYYNTDSTNWTLLVDFSLRDTNVSQVTYFYVWKDKLYFGANGDSLLYESTDGINFIANTSIETAFLPSDLLIAKIIEYNDNLYIGTNNQSPAGGQLYRTPDGTNWTNITSLLPGHGGAQDEEIHDIDTSNGFLWVTVYTDTAHTTSGMPVWRSTDETVSAFVQSNSDGFGSVDIDGENPMVTGFHGREYFGGPNYTAGGQIWRTEELIGVEDPSDNCTVLLYPNPISKNATLRIRSDCNFTGKISIYDMLGSQIQTVSVSPGTEIDLHGHPYTSGIYFYRLQDQNSNARTGKLYIE